MTTTRGILVLKRDTLGAWGGNCAHSSLDVSDVCVRQLCWVLIILSNREWEQRGGICDVEFGALSVGTTSVCFDVLLLFLSVPPAACPGCSWWLDGHTRWLWLEKRRREQTESDSAACGIRNCEAIEQFPQLRSVRFFRKSENRECKIISTK